MTDIYSKDTNKTKTWEVKLKGNDGQGTKFKLVDSTHEIVDQITINLFGRRIPYAKQVWNYEWH